MGVSDDLRECVVEAVVLGGLSRNQAAARFKVCAPNLNGRNGLIPEKRAVGAQKSGCAKRGGRAPDLGLRRSWPSEILRDPVRGPVPPGLLLPAAGSRMTQTHERSPVPRTQLARRNPPGRCARSRRAESSRCSTTAAAGRGLSPCGSARATFRRRPLSAKRRRPRSTAAKPSTPRRPAFRICARQSPAIWPASMGPRPAASRSRRNASSSPSAACTRSRSRRASSPARATRR